MPVDIFLNKKTRNPFILAGLQIWIYVNQNIAGFLWISFYVIHSMLLQPDLISAGIPC